MADPLSCSCGMQPAATVWRCGRGRSTRGTTRAALTQLPSSQLEAAIEPAIFIKSTPNNCVGSVPVVQAPVPQASGAGAFQAEAAA